MTKNKKIIQFILISIGIFLVLATYFLYPKIYENKFLKDGSVKKNETIKTSDDESNKFENVEYKGLYNVDTPFSIKSEKAYILTEEPDIVYMTNMYVNLYMKDGRIIVITSDKGHYNKVTYDCFFENNVKATDGETVVLAENMDLISTEESASIYNNVVLTNDQGSLRADKVDYDFETKYYHISMFNNKKVKIKLTQ